jgi:uncharacterized protein
MKIKVSDIENSYNVKYKEDDFAFFNTLEENSAGGISIKEPVLAEITISRQQDQFYVRGAIKGVMNLKCSRCLEGFVYPFSNNFLVILQKEEDDNALSNIHELELTQDDLKLEQFSGGELDITRIVQEQIVLLCPMKSLCNTDCKGLCPQCGVNLNKKRCKCVHKEFNSPFSTLKDLK